LDLGQKGVMDKAIAKLAEYKEGIDRNIAAQVLFGRGSDDALKLVRLNLDGVQKKAKELEDQLGLTVTLQDQANGRQYKLVINELSMAFEGIKKAIGDAVLPYLTKFGDWFVSVAPILIRGMKENMAAIVEAAFNAAEGFMNFVVKVMGGVYNLFVLWQYIQTKLGNTTVGDANAAIDQFDNALSNLSGFRDKAIGIIRDLKEKVLANKPFEGLDVGASKKGTSSAKGLLDDGGNAKDVTGAAMKQADGEIRVLQAKLAQEKLLLDQGVAQFRLTQDQKFAAVQRLTQEEYEAERKVLQNQLTIGNLSLAQKQVITNKLKELEVKHNSEMIKLDGDAVMAQIAVWKSALGTVQSSWDGQLRGLISKTTTFTQAMKNILLDLVMASIQHFEKMGINWAAAQLGMTTATTSGAAARAAAEEAAQIATLPVRAAKFASDIAANAALVYAGIFASMAPLMGPAAAGPAAVGQATVLAQLANVPKFDVGTNYVMKTGLAMIHEGEKITPAQGSGPYTGGGGAAPTFVINFTANGGMSTDEIKSHTRTIAQSLQEHWRINRSTRPDY
jgi:hypothetical protein